MAAETTTKAGRYVMVEPVGENIKEAKSVKEDGAVDIKPDKEEKLKNDYMVVSDKSHSEKSTSTKDHPTTDKIPAKAPAEKAKEIEPVKKTADVPVKTATIQRYVMTEPIVEAKQAKKIETKTLKIKKPETAKAPAHDKAADVKTKIHKVAAVKPKDKKVETAKSPTELLKKAEVVKETVKKSVPRTLPAGKKQSEECPKTASKYVMQTGAPKLTQSVFISDYKPPGKTVMKKKKKKSKSKHKHSKNKHPHGDKNKKAGTVAQTVVEATEQTSAPASPASPEVSEPLLSLPTTEKSKDTKKSANVSKIVQSTISKAPPSLSPVSDKTTKVTHEASIPEEKNKRKFCCCC